MANDPATNLDMGLAAPAASEGGDFGDLAYVDYADLIPALQKDLQLDATTDVQPGTVAQALSNDIKNERGQANPPIATGGIFTYAGGDSIIDGSWNFLAHPDRVNNVYVPANSIVYVTYRCHADKTVGSGGIYAIITCATTGTMTASSFLVSPFGNGNGSNNSYAEVTEMFNTQAPAISGVICTSGYMNGSTNGTGLVAYGTSGNGDPSDIFLTGPQNIGAPIALAMPEGLYDFGVSFYADAGVTASRSNPFLAVDVRSFPA